MDTFTLAHIATLTACAAEHQATASDVVCMHGEGWWVRTYSMAQWCPLG